MSRRYWDLGKGWVLANSKSGSYPLAKMTQYRVPNFRNLARNCDVKLYHRHQDKEGNIYYAAYSVDKGCKECNACPREGITYRACFFASQMGVKLVGWRHRQNFLSFGPDPKYGWAEGDE